jgi:hypothetical protein
VILPDEASLIVCSDVQPRFLGRTFTLEQNPYLLKFRADSHAVVVFRDGRAMAFGASDPNAALSLYGKYIGGRLA